MRPSFIGRIAWKEILSTLRDRRAIISNLVIPLLLLPVMMLGLPLLMGGLFQRETTSATQYALQGGDELPPRLRALIEAQNAELIDVPDAMAVVQADDYSAGLVVPPGTLAALDADQPLQLTVVSKSGNLRGDLNAGRIRAAASQFGQELLVERLAEVGLDPAMLQPVLVQAMDASTEAERSSGMLAWLIPFFIAIWTLTGGQMTAIDATAGEKERGTLEVLLVAPVRRGEVVAGKFIATLLFGLTAAVMAIVGYVLGGLLMRGIFMPMLGEGGGEIANVMGGSLTATPQSILLLVVSAVLLSAVVAALLLSVTLFARSFKEAQSYVAPLSFLMVIPAVSLQFRDLIGGGDSVYYIPLYNVLILMDDAVKGNVDLGQALIAWAVTAALIVALLYFAYRSFQREDVLFRT